MLGLFQELGNEFANSVWEGAGGGGGAGGAASVSSRWSALAAALPGCMPCRPVPLLAPEAMNLHVPGRCVINCPLLAVDAPLDSLPPRSLQFNPWSADSDDSEDEQALGMAARRRSSAGELPGSASAPVTPGVCLSQDSTAPVCSRCPACSACSACMHAFTCFTASSHQLKPAAPRAPAHAADSGPSARPGPTAPLADKERWIAGKYVEKRRLARPGGAGGAQQLQDWLWDAVARGDVRAGEGREGAGGRTVAYAECKPQKRQLH